MTDMNAHNINPAIVERYATLLDTRDLFRAQPNCASLLRALQAEIERLKERLALYEGTQSTPEAPIGMSGLVDDMAGTIGTIDAIKAQVWQEAIEAAAQYHDDIFKHDAGGIEYSSIVDIPIANRADLEQSCRRAELDAKAIRAIPNPYEVNKC